jgi:hypothetical protein
MVFGTVLILAQSESIAESLVLAKIAALYVEERCMASATHVE